MSNIQTGAERMPHDLSHLGFLAGQIGRLITISTTPVIAGDSFEMDAVGALRLSPLRRGLAIDSTVDIFTFYVPHRHVYGEQWIKFMKDGVNATPLPTVNTTGYIDHAAFLGTINPDTNKIPKHLFQGYLNIYNNYFKAPWMPDRTEANPNELNQDDARYGFRCCHLKNIWTAPLPPETELSRQMTTSTTSIDIMGLQAAYANLHTDQERDYFMQRYHDVISSFGGKTSYDADNRPLLVMRSNLWASGYDVDGTDQTSLGQFSGRVQQTYKHSVPRFFVPEHGTMFTLALVRFPPTATKEIQKLNAKGALTYTDIAGDPVLYGNLPPREISMKDVFRSGDSSKKFKIAEGQWYRYAPSYVSPAYRLLQGFALNQESPSGVLKERVLVGMHDYVQCFQFVFFQAEDGIRDVAVTGVQTCALPISGRVAQRVCFRCNASRHRGLTVWPSNRRGRPRCAGDAGREPGPYQCSGKARAIRPAGTREALPGTKIELRKAKLANGTDSAERF